MTARRRKSRKNSSAKALHRFSLRLMPFGFSLVRKSGPMAGIFSIIQDYSGLAGKGEGH